MLSFVDATLPIWLQVSIFFVFGLLIGSFLNVVIFRIPRGQSIISPRSSCPECGSAISPWDNIPVVSYLLLGGRCRNCRKRVSLTYPVVEILTGLLFASIAWLHGMALNSFAEMWFVSILLALVFVDAQHQLLPDRLTYPAIVIAVTAAIAKTPLFVSDLDPHVIMSAAEAGFSFSRTAVVGGLILALAAPTFWMLDQLDELLFSKYFELDREGENNSDKHENGRRYRRSVQAASLLGLSLAILWLAAVFFDSHRDPEFYQAACNNLVDALFGAIVGGGILWILRATYFYSRGIEGMGFGDIKLMAIIGAFLGWPSAILVLLMGSVIGLILGLIMLRRSGTGLRTPIPFGACLGIAAIIVVLVVDSRLYSAI